MEHEKKNPVHKTSHAARYAPFPHPHPHPRVHGAKPTGGDGRGGGRGGRGGGIGGAGKCSMLQLRLQPSFGRKLPVGHRQGRQAQRAGGGGTSAWGGVCLLGMAGVALVAPGLGRPSSVQTGVQLATPCSERLTTMHARCAWHTHGHRNAHACMPDRVMRKSRIGVAEQC